MPIDWLQSFKACRTFLFVRFTRFYGAAPVKSADRRVLSLRKPFHLSDSLIHVRSKGAEKVTPAACASDPWILFDDVYLCTRGESALFIFHTFNPQTHSVLCFKFTAFAYRSACVHSRCGVRLNGRFRQKLPPRCRWTIQSNG